MERKVEDGNVSPDATESSLRFWAIVISLCVMTFLAALEVSVITTALPVILQALRVGGEYTWVNSSFFLTSAIFQPLFGQLADKFGRRQITLITVVIYSIGCILAGAAQESAALIAGRGIQGVGSGGINVMSDIIVSDLVAQRKRGYYLAILMGVNGIGSLFGPFVGGVLAHPGSGTWRWIFLMNLPLCAIILVLLYFCLQVSHPELESRVKALKQLDYLGTALLTASTVLILLGFTWADTKYTWRSPQVLVPILVGISGLVAFWLFEKSSYAATPLVPAYLLVGRTAVILNSITFFYAITMYWLIFNVPTYFQAVQLSSPATAGLKTLPFTIALIPAAIGAGVLLSRWGRYKPLHIFGSALAVAAMGSLSSMNEHTSLAAWVAFIIMAAVGMGTLMNTMLPAFQATVTSESDQAASTALWNFVRSFGYIWGFGISTTLFNSLASSNATMVTDESLREFLQTGRTLALGTADQIRSYPNPVDQQLHHVFTLSLQRAFLIGLVFPSIAFLLSFFEQEIPLKTTLESEFGLAKD